MRKIKPAYKVNFRNLIGRFDVRELNKFWWSRRIEL